ncbi:MAG: tRNA (adenosine(37)-N6)-threonylcarbamoyltransferase complex dimerization subunit type 1 TsaB [Acidimicrobiales bacterium]|jgi:tRNA threonylcarbamoyladenosine biosynthesis protein TsaB|nr:tRNA (adenosine(37)-N6)-threonylcarbamoyltransferase complex dimerization subunit type 1 TsaB [Acidimicrobiales bacterium]HJM28420.1 tRNA (adenosine(37)-N6)-threonylcarbamoyltransferase complex dimerization subunit type 1 TsaB [Acidimicrobiales bacterium]HJM97654.1 tRNA (adenosine(37)-N6)-threonylcarbamoyltransferase complex dimerization subunit type 1 TsaB [Acidimicrobiales bacterium]
MLILGIESSTSQVGCAIGGHEGVLASAHSSRGKRHAENLTPQIDFVRQQARVELDEISVVAVDIGPGLYTGLRVGVTAAISIAFGLGVPMIGVSSLDLIAYPVRHCQKLIAAVIDARRGEIFYSSYRQVPGGIQRVTDPIVSSPEDLSAELQAQGTETLMVGDGALRYADHFDNLRGVESAEPGLAYPSASSLVQLAHAKALREDFVNPSELKPLYLRKPDALEINMQPRRAQ